jgi:hypothetical protein
MRFFMAPLLMIRSPGCQPVPNQAGDLFSRLEDGRKNDKYRSNPALTQRKSLKIRYMFVNGYKKLHGGAYMGLWLKCPKCQAANPLDLKSCQECNASLENLPAAKRVYILGDAAPAAPKKAAPKAAAPKAAPAKKAAAKAKPKPKTKPKVAPEEMDLEVIASTAPPPKRAKGPKGRKKKKE